MNKRHYKSLVAAAILTGLSQQAAQATELDKIFSSQDTWVNISNGGQDSNLRGDINAMKIGGKNTAFVQFIIAPDAIPAGEVIDKVMLEMKVTGKVSIPDTYIAALTNPDVAWDETTIGESTWPFVIGDKIPGAVLTSDTTQPEGDWLLKQGTKHQFDISSAVTGPGTYTFNVDSEDTLNLDIKWAAGEYSKDLTTQLGRPALIITTKLAPASDTIKPIFADIPAIEIDATGTKTDISSLVNITASDDTDGAVPATIVGETSLISGAHTVTLEATDAAGNQATKDVTVNITPLLVLTQPVTISLPPGENASASIALSGPAVNYPATVDYTVAGDAANDTSSTLTFTAENYTDAQNVDITLAGDAQDGQTAVLTLTTTSNVQENNDTVTVTTFDGNLAPTLTLTLAQSGATIATINAGNADTIPYIDATKGPVTVTVNVADFNSGDTHATSWANTSEALTAESDSFDFSPLGLSGDFTLSVNTTEENTTEKLSSLLTTKIRIIATKLPELVVDADSDGDGITDIDEGFNDSDGDGIVDYLDDNSDTTQLPLAEGQKALQTVDGLTLSLGSVSAAQGLSANSAVITLQDLADNVAPDSADTTDTGYAPIEGASLFNFSVNGVANGATAPIVYPLPTDVVLGEETEYRKYTPKNGWVTFVSDADNTIASAAKDETGHCPAPESELYLDGLKADNNCIQLTIQDGGIYDADGEANGTIEDPGVLAETYTVIAWSTDTIALPATSVNEGSSVTLTQDLSTYLGSADVSSLTFSVEDDASWLTIDDAGVLTADVSKLTTGDYSATVSFNDNKAQTGETKVSVSVAYNNAPEFSVLELTSASRNVAYTGTIAPAISDVENDVYTVEKLSGPYWLKVSQAGILSGTPLKANIGDNKITVKLTDAKGASTEATFNVSVADSEVRASDGGSFSAGLLTLLGLLSLGRKKSKK